MLQSVLTALAWGIGLVNLIGGPAWAFDQARFERGTAQLEALAAADHQFQSHSQVGQWMLRPSYHTRLALIPPAQSRGTVLLLHGYTAGPWQMPELCSRFNTAGFHCFVPRLPGHGWMTAQGVGTGQKMVSYAARYQEYDAFLEQVYAPLLDLQQPVYPIGLSGGANLALRLAERHPEIQRVAAIAPFLGPTYPLGFGFRSLDALNALTGGGVSALLAAVPYNENTRSQPEERTAHTQGSLNNALAIYQVGRDIQRMNATVQFVSTEPDALGGEGPIRELFERLGGEARHGWYHYQADEGVPHAMISPLEGRPEAVAHLHQLLIHFVASGERFWRPPPPPAWWQRVHGDKGL
ncbi:MAG: alpha/beta hydrolase [Candidatus Sericytochromatia bacterium]